MRCADPSMTGSPAPTTPEPTKVERIRSDLQAEASQLRAELWGLCNGNFGCSPPLFCYTGHSHHGHLPVLDPWAQRAELEQISQERDAAWQRCEAMERKLEIERLTARACATEAVEVREKCEERSSEVLEELAAAEAENAKLREMVMSQGMISQNSLLHEIHNKVMASLSQGEELKQHLQASTSPSNHQYHQLSHVVRGSSTPLQPCDWFQTQGTLCKHQREVEELTERLRASTEELREYDLERVTWSRRAAELEGSLEEGEMVRQDLEKMVETLKVKLERSEEHTAMLEEHTEFTEHRGARAYVDLTVPSRQEDFSIINQDLPASRPGAKLRYALRDASVHGEPLALELPSPSTVMLPPPKVVRVVEESSSVPTASLSGMSPSSGEFAVKNYQCFLDASVTR